MTSKDLSRDQLERIERVVARHRRYYEMVWKRAQANDMTVADPFVAGVCKAWEHVNQLADLLERMKNAKPQPYRPSVEPGKTSGLAWREMPWAEKQRQAMEEVRREEAKPKTPGS